MKKYVVILMMLLLLSTMVACGKKGGNVSDKGNGNEEEMVLDEGSQSEDEDVEETSKIDYEQQITDKEGNILFEYNIPLGWELESDSNIRFVSLKHIEDYRASIYIRCTTNQVEDVYNLYEYGTYTDEEDTVEREYYSDGEMETVYGTVKLIYEDCIPENYGDSEYAIFKQSDEEYVCIRVPLMEQDTMDYSESYRKFYIENVVASLMGEKQVPLDINYEYPYWACGQNGEKIMGVNVPKNMVYEEPSLDKNDLYMENSESNIYVQVIDFNTLFRILNRNSNAYDKITPKGEMETLYGTALMYELYLNWGQFDGLQDAYQETAILGINGVPVAIYYYDYDATGYTGELERLMESELFAQN